ncbi:Uma2 family endonuclease [Dolichospermum circinale]|uniref:Uma2 family endonuclease n=1 Tax=Dolichospermum circinale CS-537/01 TaxID=3021739 RepID=A0ABT5AAD9_9CYAN|nr:Uma2 family endonuclease [Dolichospermum circinale]MDB9467132.1 Uma2 family endonuclease [Dolichospermum circinale CS-539/09]MDB9469242.1 Uma2 family endonuclease [Dolichospermum circinale CS-539]MDB9488909.1 Uma2 family endonuclease [Dolichospermum circinale CS-537/01]
MTQVKIKLTVEEFLALPENDTTYEFVDGEAIPKYKNQQMSPKFFHGSTTGALFILFIILSTWAQAKGRVVVEWAIKLTKNQEIWIPVPDLTYVSYHRLSADWLEDEACPVIPELVMEIISPGQTFGDMIEKAIYYLQAGILLVWIVDTISQTITVFTQSSLPATFREHQIITHEILPGLEITPHTIFQCAGLIR